MVLANFLRYPGGHRGLEYAILEAQRAKLCKSKA